MKKVVIIGGGFAGLSAARRLSCASDNLEVILLDKSAYSHFLPLLPDCIGRRITHSYLIYPLKDLSRAFRFNFLNQHVRSVDLDNRRISTQTADVAYDYLIIAAGSQTTFYGNDGLRKNASVLDDAFDARDLAESIVDKSISQFIVVGGGYTGIEIATNINLYLRERKPDKKVFIVERANSILGPLPQWMKDYTMENLDRLDIKVLTGRTLEKVENRQAFLSDKSVYNDSLVVWSAGVEAPGFVRNLNKENTPQGRIKIDKHLRLRDNCFVAGDSCLFEGKEGFLRMSIQFAITQGDCAAKNILRDIAGSKLKEFRPFDLGYIVPMANNKSCGIALGKSISGMPATFLHYFMCIYRSIGIRNKAGILRGLLQKGHD